MIVCKFGGTSVATPENAKRIKKIVDADEKRKIVVVSAIGKSEDFDWKVTDLLFTINYLLEVGENCENEINQVFLRYENLSNCLGIKINWSKEKQIFINNIKKGINKNYIVSRGEYYSALMYSKYLNANFLDAKKFIIFKKDGKINEKLTKNRLKTLNFCKKYVIGGYYGAFSDGTIAVFGRGGSDITGAVLCKLLNFDIYENYTDVDGVFNRNPNIFNCAKRLPIINSAMAIKMADAGNEVVHRDALKIMKVSKSLLIVKNTKKETTLGTIVADINVDYGGLCLCVAEKIVCKINEYNKDVLEKIKLVSDLDKVIYFKKYHILINSLYCREEDINSLNEHIFIGKCCVFTFFSNLKIDTNNLKIIKKISKKAKKYAILCKFLSNFNNFVIICSVRNKGYVIEIINKYL